MIDRSVYLTMCRRCSMLKEEDVMGIKQNVPESLTVVCDGHKYYPISYELSFDSTGRAVHKGCLHDMRANSIITAKLEKIHSSSAKESEVKNEEV